jgi:hypothetical protein
MKLDMNIVCKILRLGSPRSARRPRARARNAAWIWLAIFALWFGLAPVTGQTRIATFDRVQDIPARAIFQIHGPFYGGANGIRFDVLGPEYFSPRDATDLNGGGVPGRAQNGTPFLQQYGPNALIATAYTRTGLPDRFAVISVDLAESSTVVGAELARFVGYRTDGGVVTAEFMPDGIIAGEGPLVDFETFHFDDRFNDLIKFEAVKFGSLDNLVFAPPVPEPAIMVLLALGGVALVLVRRVVLR